MMVILIYQLQTFLNALHHGDITLTFSNPAEGQSGTVMLVNSGGHTISAHAKCCYKCRCFLLALTTAWNIYA